MLIVLRQQFGNIESSRFYWNIKLDISNFISKTIDESSECMNVGKQTCAEKEIVWADCLEVKQCSIVSGVDYH